MGWDDQNSRYAFKRRLKKIRRIKTWQLFILLFMMVIVSATFLRLNSLGMAERRAAVIAADEKGDKVALRTQIVELQTYVSRHMNTNITGGLYLASSYERDRDAALAAAQSTSNPNSAVYEQASIECRARFQGGVASFRNDYVQCVVEKVGSLAPHADPISGLQLPKADAYRISFASPIWTPDIAGFSVLICVLILLTIATRFAMVIVLRTLLRRHYRST